MDPALAEPQDQTRLAAIQAVFTPQECAQLIADYRPLLAPAGIDALSPEQSQHMRKSSAVFIPMNERNAWVFDRLRTAITELNNSIYGFEVDDFREGIQFTCYEKGEFYRPHFDIGPGRLAERKLSMTVQLSPASDYSGGELVIYPEFIASKDQGTMTVFPSFMCHGVRPVTQGVRYSLVCWLAGPAFR